MNLDLFLSPADAARAVSTLRHLARHDLSRFALTGGFAIESQIHTHGGQPHLRTLHDIDFLVDTNLKATIFTNQAAYAVMRNDGGGRIINFGSGEAVMGSPISALVVKSIGPTIRSRPRSRSHTSAASSNARAASGASSHSNQPNSPQALPWNSLKLPSMWALMRPIARPSR